MSLAQELIAAPTVQNFLDRLSGWGEREWKTIAAQEYPPCRFGTPFPEILDAVIEMLDGKIRPSEINLGKLMRAVRESNTSTSYRDAEVQVEYALFALIFEGFMEETTAWDQAAFDRLVAPVRAVDPTIGVPLRARITRSDFGRYNERKNYENVQVSHPG